jgi:hypothetical protein
MFQSHELMSYNHKLKRMRKGLSWFLEGLTMLLAGNSPTTVRVSRPVLVPIIADLKRRDAESDHPVWVTPPAPCKSIQGNAQFTAFERVKGSLATRRPTRQSMERFNAEVRCMLPPYSVFPNTMERINDQNKLVD